MKEINKSSQNFKVKTLRLQAWAKESSDDVGRGKYGKKFTGDEFNHELRRNIRSNEAFYPKARAARKARLALKATTLAKSSTVSAFGVVH